MTNIKIGDRVKVKDRADWPSPPGFRLANAEGTVVAYLEYDEVLERFQDYIYVQLEKAEGEGKVYLGNRMFFKSENLEKI